MNWRTKTMKRIVAVLALAGCCLTGAKAQMGQTAAKVPAGTIIEPGKSMEALLKIYEDEITGAVNAMPADKFNFAPSPAIFKADQGVKYETVRTFGAMVAHIAQANYYFFSTLGGAKPDVDMKAIGDMTSKEDTVKALAGSFAYALKQLPNLSPASDVAAGEGRQTQTRMAECLMAHGVDAYLKLVGGLSKI